MYLKGRAELPAHVSHMPPVWEFAKLDIHVVTMFKSTHRSGSLRTLLEKYPCQRVSEHKADPGFLCLASGEWITVEDLCRLERLWRQRNSRPRTVARPHETNA